MPRRRDQSGKLVPNAGLWEGPIITMPNEVQKKKKSVQPRDGKRRDEGTIIPHSAHTLDLEKERFLQGLYKSCWSDLCGWLRQRYGAGPPEPEDIAQQAFTRLAALDSIAHIQHPKSFLYATAINLAVNAVKWVSRTRTFIDDELSGSSQKLEEMTPERVYQGKEKFAVMLREVDGLTEKQKEILVRSRFKGQTYDEIAIATGWSSADISRQINMALKIVSDALKNYDEGKEKRHD